MCTFKGSQCKYTYKVLLTLCRFTAPFHKNNPSDFYIITKILPILYTAYLCCIILTITILTGNRSI